MKARSNDLLEEYKKIYNKRIQAVERLTKAKAQKIYKEVQDQMTEDILKEWK